MRTNSKTTTNSNASNTPTHRVFFFGEKAVMHALALPPLEPQTLGAATNVPALNHKLCNELGDLLADPNVCTHPPIEALAVGAMLFGQLVPQVLAVSRDLRTHIITAFRRADGTYSVAMCASLIGDVALDPEDLNNCLLNALATPHVAQGYAREKWAHDSVIHTLTLKALALTRRGGPPSEAFGIN